MSKLKKLITEIHHRSLWQVLLIYVGALSIAPPTTRVRRSNENAHYSA